MCKCKLPTARLSKVIVWQTDRHDQNYIPRCFAGGQLHNVYCLAIAAIADSIYVHLDGVFIFFQLLQLKLCTSAFPILQMMTSAAGKVGLTYDTAISEVSAE